MTNGQGITWVKSSYSGADGGDCVELAVGERTMPVRDSKCAGSGPVIEFGRAAFGRFLESVREG
ncbi:DUF397 domain-containing protein [Streptomyces sp. SPB074]|uniref:DUF397 domain-containing protein n=1 Tax=Streptomyces sp. (strain SPB074) TaxID=465543 RepID=UPI00017F15EA|nr:DUF397 domain-containing protein [Streptomyces sp. SPB074]EDY44384.1 conserved hypothetical protein [Streptomyces sp. SPB074]